MESLVEIFPMETVLYCDPNDHTADAFEAILRNMGLQGRRVGDAKAACQGADIVVTLTLSTRQILEPVDVPPGTFVARIGADNPHKHELAGDLLSASHLVVDSLLQASTMGDLHHAIVSGEMTAGSVYSELADLVVGRVAGRSDKAERWVIDSTGLAAQDLAAAVMVYELARANEDIPRMQFND